MKAPETTPADGAEAREDVQPPATSMTGTGLSLGISIGAAFGVAFDALGAGVAIGIVAGLISGAALDARAAESGPSN